MKTFKEYLIKDRTVNDVTELVGALLRTLLVLLLVLNKLIQ